MDKLNQVALYFQTNKLALTVLLVWIIAWKGIALWKAARNGNTKWFVALLVVNTVGLLEILYIFVFAKHKWCCSQNKIK